MRLSRWVQQLRLAAGGARRLPYALLNLLPEVALNRDCRAVHAGANKPLPFSLFVRGGRLDGREEASWLEGVDTRNTSAQDRFNCFMRPLSLGRKPVPAAGVGPGLRRDDDRAGVRLWGVEVGCGSWRQATALSALGTQDQPVARINDRSRISGRS